MAVALDVDLAGPRELRREEALAAAAAHAQAARVLLDAVLHGLLPGDDAVRVHDQLLARRQHLVREHAHGPDEGDAVALQDLADHALAAACVEINILRRVLAEPSRRWRGGRRDGSAR